MKKSNINEIIYESFVGMCKILKEKGGVMNKAIAIDMGIDFGIFSKLLSGKRPISDMYRDKIYAYFKDGVFSRYAKDLKLHICDVLCLPDSSIAYKKIMVKPYPDLLYYLFYGFNEDDLTVEDDVRAMFIFYVKKYFAKILDAHPVECGGYKIILDDDTHDLEKKLGLPDNYVMEIGRFVHNAWEGKIYILLCPQMWNKGREIFRDPEVVECADCYMVVRLSDSFTDNLFAMGGISKVMDTTAEFETIRVGNLCRKAHQLAEMIFNKLCEDSEITGKEA